MILIDCSIKNSANETTSLASNLSYTLFSCNAEYQSFRRSTARSTVVRKKYSSKNEIELSFNQA